MARENASERLQQGAISLQSVMPSRHCEPSDELDQTTAVWPDGKQTWASRSQAVCGHWACSSQPQTWVSGSQAGCAGSLQSLSSTQATQVKPSGSHTVIAGQSRSSRQTTQVPLFISQYGCRTSSSRQ